MTMFATSSSWDVAGPSEILHDGLFSGSLQVSLIFNRCNNFFNIQLLCCNMCLIAE